MNMKEAPQIVLRRRNEACQGGRELRVERAIET
jgi:hypothetical protein